LSHQNFKTTFFRAIKYLFVTRSLLWSVTYYFDERIIERSLLKFIVI